MTSSWMTLVLPMAYAVVLDRGCAPTGQRAVGKGGYICLLSTRRFDFPRFGILIPIPRGDGLSPNVASWSRDPNRP
jgi:hypothetical protein